jgi:hypothetical protein
VPLALDPPVAASPGTVFGTVSGGGSPLGADELRDARGAGADGRPPASGVRTA